MKVRTLDVDAAAGALDRGDVVAVPTDTVYGVGARLDDAAAVERLFALKARPRHVALPVLIGSLEDVATLGVQWPESAQRLAERYWPGALTIVTRAPQWLATRVGSTHSVGLRWPRHDILEGLIARCGPLAVTSANEHAHPPCTNADEVRAAQWAAPLGGVLDVGECAGAVSSVVEVLAQQWWLRREGAIERAAIEALLGPESSRDDN